MDREYSELEKEQMILEIEETHKKSHAKGKQIITVICVVNMIFAAISFALYFDIIALIGQLILCTALYAGVTWVRYFYAISGVVTLMISSQMFFYIMEDTNLPIKLYLIFVVLFTLTSTILLFISQAVSDFLYSQKNG